MKRGYNAPSLFIRIYDCSSYLLPAPSIPKCCEIMLYYIGCRDTESIYGCLDTSHETVVQIGCYFWYDIIWFLRYCNLLLLLNYLCHWLLRFCMFAGFNLPGFKRLKRAHTNLSCHSKVIEPK